jgi:hypothetical protein
MAHHIDCILIGLGVLETNETIRESEVQHSNETENRIAGLRLSVDCYHLGCFFNHSIVMYFTVRKVIGFLEKRCMLCALLQMQ